MGLPRLKGVKRQMALLMTLIMTLSLSPSISFANGDYTGHWAAKSIERAVEMGWFAVSETNTYRPNDSITRAEFVAMINRMKGYEGNADLSQFSDVKPSDWFYGAFAAAVANGYIYGNEGRLNPQDRITRNEAIAIFSRISGLDTSADYSRVFTNVKDAAQIPDWAKPSVGASILAGLTAGYDENFNGTSNITRAETAVMLERLYDDIRVYGFRGTYTGSAAGVLVTAPGVTLKDMNVSGDLTIAATVGDGEVYLDTVNVGGKLDIQGGGKNSVYINNSNIESVVVTKDGVRVVLADGTEVFHAIVEGEAIEIEFGGGVNVGTLVIESNAANANVKIANGVTIDNVEVAATGSNIEMGGGATVNEITVSAPDIVLDINNGAVVGAVNVSANSATVNMSGGAEVDKLNIDPAASNTSLDLTNGAKINTLNIEGNNTTVTGNGDIGVANVNASDTSFQQNPGELNASSGVTVNVGGSNVSGSGTTSSSSGGGSSSNSNNDNTSPSQSTVSVTDVVVSSPFEIYFSAASNISSVTIGDVNLTLNPTPTGTGTSGTQPSTPTNSAIYDNGTWIVLLDNEDALLANTNYTMTVTRPGYTRNRVTIMYKYAYNITAMLQNDVEVKPTVSAEKTISINVTGDLAHAENIFTGDYIDNFENVIDGTTKTPIGTTLTHGGKFTPLAINLTNILAAMGVTEASDNLTIKQTNPVLSMYYGQPAIDAKHHDATVTKVGAEYVKEKNIYTLAGLTNFHVLAMAGKTAKLEIYDKDKVLLLTINVNAAGLTIGDVVFFDETESIDNADIHAALVGDGSDGSGFRKYNDSTRKNPDGRPYLIYNFTNLTADDIGTDKKYKLVYGNESKNIEEGTDKGNPEGWYITVPFKSETNDAAANDYAKSITSITVNGKEYGMYSEDNYAFFSLDNYYWLLSYLWKADETGLQLGLPLLALNSGGVEIIVKATGRSNATFTLNLTSSNPMKLDAISPYNDGHFFTEGVSVNPKFDKDRQTVDMSVVSGYVVTEWKHGVQHFFATEEGTALSVSKDHVFISKKTIEGLSIPVSYGIVSEKETYARSGYTDPNAGEKYGKYCYFYYPSIPGAEGASSTTILELSLLDENNHYASGVITHTVTRLTAPTPAPTEQEVLVEINELMLPLDNELLEDPFVELVAPPVTSEEDNATTTDTLGDEGNVSGDNVPNENQPEASQS